MIEVIYYIFGIMAAAVGIWRFILWLRERGKPGVPQDVVFLTKDLSQKDVDKGINWLKTKLVKEYDFDLIVAISSGGAIVGGMLSTLLNIPLTVIVRSNPRLQETNPERSVTMYFYSKIIRGKKILLVDDIVRSGFTLKKYFEETAKTNPSEIKSAALVLAGEHPLVVPDFYVYRAEKIELRMPWDYHKKSR